MLYINKSTGCYCWTGVKNESAIDDLLALKEHFLVFGIKDLYILHVPLQTEEKAVIINTKYLENHERQTLFDDVKNTNNWRQVKIENYEIVDT